MKTKRHGEDRPGPARAVSLLKCPCGSETHTFEVGVELTAVQHISGRAGEWGRVYRVSEPGSPIAFLDIQLARYSRDSEAFFAAATGVPSWQVKPHGQEDSE